MARKLLRNPNNYGTIVHLGKNRRRPYAVKVNPRLNSKGYYNYDILGYYEERVEAMIALAEYNKNPCDLNNRNITFQDVFDSFYKDKYEISKKQFSISSKNSTSAAFRNCSCLHNKKFLSLRHSDLQAVVDSCTLKYSSLELIISLFHQMYAFAIREGISEKDASKFVKINITDDDIHGIRFSEDDIFKLWNKSEYESVRMILIYIYTGWRATELLEIPRSNIDIKNMTISGGKKTAAGKNRIVPVHSKIKSFIIDLCNTYPHYLFTDKSSHLSYSTFKKKFYEGLTLCNITTRYTPHDCRHTFESKLNDAGISPVICDRLMGHASKSLGEKIYTHKTIEQLRSAIESMN